MVGRGLSILCKPGGVQGAKRFILMSPTTGSRAFHHPDFLRVQENLCENAQPHLLSSLLPPGDVVWVADVCKGQTLFIPAGWWHCVFYLEGGYSINLHAYSTLPHLALGSALSGVTYPYFHCLDSCLTAVQFIYIYYRNLFFFLFTFTIRPSLNGGNSVKTFLGHIIWVASSALANIAVAYAPRKCLGLHA